MAGLIDRTVTGFVEELASDSPAPGGGSSSALAGAMAAGLVAMVCRLSIDKEGLAASSKELVAVLERMDAVRPELLRLVDEDTAAFDKVMDAVRMPKATDEEKAARRAALQSATLFAAQVPLETLRTCRRVVDAAASLVGRANPAAASDLGVGIELARTGAEGALLNVAINVASLPTGPEADALKVAAEEEIAAVRTAAETASRGVRGEVGLD